MRCRFWMLLTACLSTAIVAWSVVSLAAPAIARQSEAAAAAKTAPSTVICREIHRIVGNMKHTKYQHPTRVDEEAGRYELDCSGLVCYLLQRVLPKHYAGIEFPKKQSRARAMDFHAYFASASTDPQGKDGWRRIERILDARPGDILAWRAANPQAGSTGHVVIIDSKPVATRDGQVCVAVIDSTGSGHGADTRGKGESGIGRGLMWFTVDAAGRPVGYRWSRANGRVRERPIAIGRAVPLPEEREAKAKKKSPREG